MNPQEKYTLIEKYLAEEMRGEELENFEAQLQVDEALRDELELHQQISETLKGEKVHELRSVLKEVNQNWEDGSKKESARVIQFNLKRILTIAAAVVLLFFAYQFLMPSNLSSQEIYATHFEPYPMLLNQRSIDQKTDDQATYNNAISFYTKQQYPEALTAFEKLLATQPDNITYQFYQANILLADNKAEQAIPVFQKILDGDHPNFEEQARWYLAMAHLQREDLKNAKALLEKIEAGQYKSKEATKILKSGLE
ncbi:MAG: tetratricopeptide repeat protein [Bacteroidota bacterium]